eukprot:5144491-Pyramimonas_sp.AAC.2
MPSASPLSEQTAFQTLRRPVSQAMFDTNTMFDTGSVFGSFVWRNDSSVCCFCDPKALQEGDLKFVSFKAKAYPGSGYVRP